MKPYYEEPGIQIFHGDCREVLSRIPPESVAMIMTSPPYTDLRNYLRIKPSEYVDWFLPVAHQLKRVMTPTGNFFLNINKPILCLFR